MGSGQTSTAVNGSLLPHSLDSWARGSGWPLQPWPGPPGCPRGRYTDKAELQASGCRAEGRGHSWVLTPLLAASPLLDLRFHLCLQSSLSKRPHSKNVLPFKAAE